jgi:hypothetical protein
MYNLRKIITNRLKYWIPSKIARTSCGNNLSLQNRSSVSMKTNQIGRPKGLAGS